MHRMLSLEKTELLLLLSPSATGPLDWLLPFGTPWSRKTHQENPLPVNDVLAAFLLGWNLAKKPISESDPELVEQMLGHIRLKTMRYLDGSVYMNAKI